MGEGAQVEMGVSGVRGAERENNTTRSGADLKRIQNPNLPMFVFSSSLAVY